MKVAYINGKIFTSVNEDDFISEFAVENGVFTDIGSVDKSGCDKVIDLGGKTVLPAFSDAHTHPTYVMDIVDSLFCNQPNIYSIKELIEYMKTSPYYGKEGEWIKGWCYDESKLEENRTPTTKDLDQISTTQPIFIQRSCGHSCICNSKALELAGITKDTKDPAGGKIGRYEDGTPNGFMYDLAASNMIRNAMYKRDLEKDAKKVGELGKHYASLGIVNLSDMMCFSSPYKATTMYKLAKKYGFTQRISMYNMWEDIKKHSLDGFSKEDLEGEIKIAGVKFFMDGSLSGKSGYVNEPYKDGSTGFLVHPEDDDMKEAIKWAYEHKCQISFHAMGDGSIDKIINEVAKYDTNWMGECPSIRIEHVSLLTAEQIKRIQTLKVKFSFHPQPIFSYAELDGYTAALNKKELDRVCALKTWTNIAFDDITISSDAPATIHQSPENLFVTIKAATKRVSTTGEEYNKNEEISVAKAVMMLTRNTQKSLLLDNCTMIKNGYSADFIVLDKDIFSIEKDQIDTINVEKTYFKGELIYTKN